MKMAGEVEYDHTDEEGWDYNRSKSEAVTGPVSVANLSEGESSQKSPKHLNVKSLRGGVGRVVWSGKIEGVLPGLGLEVLEEGEEEGQDGDDVRQPDLQVAPIR